MYIDTIFNGFMLDVWCWSRRWEFMFMLHSYTAKCVLNNSELQRADWRWPRQLTLHSWIMIDPSTFQTSIFMFTQITCIQFKKDTRKRQEKYVVNRWWSKRVFILKGNIFLNFLLKCIQLLVVETNVYFYIHKNPS